MRTAIAGTFLLAEAGALLYAQMPHYHDKIILLSKVRSYNARRDWRRWAVLSVLPIADISR